MSSGGSDSVGVLVLVVAAVRLPWTSNYINNTYLGP